MASTQGMELQRSEFHRNMNRKMIEILPELNSRWSLCPMAIGNWRNPEDVLDNGEPCFIASEKPYDFKQDYVWMPTHKGLMPGYYHLRTQEAYIEVCDRFRRAKRRRKMFETKTPDDELYKKVHDILINRRLSDKPSDLHAARARLLHVTAFGGQKKAAGKAAYLPTLVATVALSLGADGF